MSSPWQHRSKAGRRWPNAEWIRGDGPHAVLAHCDVLTVSLHWVPRGAEEAIQVIDRYGCGHACHGHHEIVTLTETSESNLWKGVDS